MHINKIIFTSQSRLYRTTSDLKKTKDLMMCEKNQPQPDFNMVTSANLYVGLGSWL